MQYWKEQSWGSVRAGSTGASATGARATGASALVNFQKTPFAPVDFTYPFRKERKLGQFLTGLDSQDNDLHPSLETHCGAPAPTATKNLGLQLLH